METTITSKGEHYTVEYDFIPGEERILYDNNNEGYPGSGAEVKIIHIWDIDDNDVTTTLCHALISELVLEKII